MKNKFIALLLGAVICLSMTITGCQSNSEPEDFEQSQSDTFDASGTSDASGASDSSGASGEPTTSGTSDILSTSDTSVIPDTSGASDASGAPDASITSNTSDTSNTPNASDTSNTTSTTGTSGTTVTSSTSNTPITSDTSGTSNPANGGTTGTGHKKSITDITAMKLFGQMTVGWNLGNTLDSVGSGLSSETAWGNPKATKELIDAVKAAGFNTVRIPVTWMGHYTKDTFEIDSEWLARVKEVVDYVLDNDMYAIINIHHDGNDTAQSWLTPEPSDEAAMVAQFETLWKQIAEYFNEYDEHLLFAGMNEFHHGYSNPSSKYLRITDELNQSFVTTVRATGGNNAKRILICPAYNTNGEASLKMTMPKDTVNDKLMMEIHFYDPWDFAGSGKGDWGQTGTQTAGWGQESWVDNIFGRIKAKFFDNGIPVILGEYGAVNNKSGYDDFRRYYVEYVTKAAKENGLLPIWWDNGYDGSSGEAFSLFSRYAYTKLHEDIHEAIMRAVSGKNYTIELPYHN